MIVNFMSVFVAGSVQHVKESGLAQDADLCNIAGNTISIPTIGSVLATVLSGLAGPFRIYFCYLCGVITANCFQLSHISPLQISRLVGVQV